jgi:AraC-like DNA-binding protein
MTVVEVNGIDAWAEACSRNFVPLAVRSGDEGFAARLASVDLGDGLTVTKVVSAGSDVIRDHRMLRAHPRDDVLLSIQGRGVGFVCQEGRTAAIGHGASALYDSSSAYTLRFPSAMSELVLQVPRSALGLDPGALRQITARPIASGAGSVPALTAVLCGAFDDFGRELLRAPSGSAAIAHTVVDLLRSTIRSLLDPRERGVMGRAALTVSAHQYIEANCADPDLTPAAVAAHHHISIRQLQVLLADAGESPAELIRRSRLSVARGLLDRGLPVAEAAARAGFEDPGTFTRAFKRTYSMLPSEVFSSV